MIGYTLIALLVLGSAGAYIWEQNFKKAEPGVFYAALRTALSSEGLTCEIKKQGEQNSSRQIISLDLESKTNARSVTTLAQQKATVVTEGIATKTDDYVRYTSINAPGKNAQGKSFNFSPVLNVWGKQPRANLGGMSLYDQAAFGGCIVPMAHFPEKTVDRLISELDDGLVFKTDQNNIRRTRLAGKPVYSYEVTLSGPVYIKFMKKIAKEAGNKSLDDVNEETYAQRSPEKLTFLIHRSTHRLEQIVFSGQKQTVTFSDYGRKPEIIVPEKTISTVELQKRLESVQ
jgi:hypothetical protein